MTAERGAFPRRKRPSRPIGGCFFFEPIGGRDDAPGPKFRVLIFFPLRARAVATIRRQSGATSVGARPPSVGDDPPTADPRDEGPGAVPRGPARGSIAARRGA